MHFEICVLGIEDPKCEFYEKFRKAKLQVNIHQIQAGYIIFYMLQERYIQLTRRSTCPVDGETDELGWQYSTDFDARL